MFSTSRGIARNVGPQALSVMSMLIAHAVPAPAGLKYQASIDLEDCAICVDCVTKVTVSVASQPICHDCDLPDYCPPIGNFYAELTLNGACFVTGQAACGETECVAPGSACLKGTVTCPTVNDPDPKIWGCPNCNDNCGPSCQAFTISPGGSKTFWIKGLTPGYYTIGVHGARPCGENPPIRGYDSFGDEMEFTVLWVNIDTDSDNNGVIDWWSDDPIEELFPGRVLWPNVDNDDHEFQDTEVDLEQAGPIPGENDLAEILLSVSPPDYEGTATLTVPESVWVWMDQVKTASSATDLPVEILPWSHWVEGLADADAAELTLTVENCSDTIKMTVFKVNTLSWVGYGQGNRAPSACPEGYNTGSLCIYPEAVGFSETPESLPLRRRIKLQGTVVPAPGVDGLVKVYLKHWDPDDPSADGDAVDNIPEGIANAGPDNAGKGAGFFVQGDGPLSTATVSVDAAGNFVVDYFQVTLQPGDNYCVSATTTPEYHSTNTLTQEDVDGFMAETPGGGLYPSGRGHSYISQMLTTRRTLWVELDSMAAPIMPGDGPFHGAGVNPDGGEVGDDDVDPGGALNLADTSLLEPEFEKAYVDIAIVPPEVDTTEHMPFIHNYQYNAVVSPARDTGSQEMHWIVQVLNAYEAHEADDIDPNSETWMIGHTFPNHQANATCYIFSETIRDVAANYEDCDTDLCPGIQPRGTIEARTVLHETLHRFNMPHQTNENEPIYDWESGPLDPIINTCCADDDNRLHPIHIHKIRTTPVP